LIGNFNIVDYCKRALSRFSITSTGELTAECPFCGKYGAFYVNNKTGNYICFKCDNKGRGGVGLIAEVEGISWSEAKSYLFSRSVKFRRRKTPITLLDKIKKIGGREETEEEEQVKCKFPDKMIKIWDGKKWRFPKYLKKRGVDRDTARIWQLGYCEYGDYAHRLIIPINCPNGFSFTARDMDGDAKLKYKNPKGISHSKLVLGWEYIDPSIDIVLVEGPLDVIKMWQYGFNSLCLFGKVLHKHQLNMINSYFGPDTSFVVMLDPEEINAPFRVASQLACRYEDINIAKLPLGVDPGSATIDQVNDAINNAKSFSKWRTCLLSSKLAASSSCVLNG
jgi:DNA primase